MEIPEVPSPDAEDTYSADLRSMLGRNGGLVGEPEKIVVGEKIDLKRRKMTHRATLAYMLVGLYATVTLVTLVSLVAGWAAYSELRDYLGLVYGALTGLVGAAIGLLARKGAS